MSRKHLAVLTAFATIVALACVASFANAAGTATAQTRPTATALAGTTTQVGAVTVRLTVKKFVKRGKSIYAIGTATTRFKPSAEQAGQMPSKTVKKAFTARVVKMKRVASAKRICPVLELTLAPLDLNLLGLMIHLDRVHLVITADSNGGLLGSLLCGLAGSGRLGPRQMLLNWTQAAQQSGLATRGVTLTVPLYQTTSSTGASSLSTSPGASPLAICTVLDLTLGPLDLNLLGLMVHLDRVHLLITADSEGGILGSLLCSLAGGTPSG
jgi:hypothetical protein